MSDFQAQKQLVLDFYRVLDGPGGDSAQRAFDQFVHHDLIWRGFHPFDQMQGHAPVAAFWQPFRQSFTAMQRRMDIFIAGKNEMDGQTSVWVASMGHLVGLFDAPWLGIRPTRKMAMLRYAEFHRVEAGKITETAFYFDIPHLMVQAGQNPFGPQTAQHMVQPGPVTHDGLLYAAQDPAAGDKTLATINEMVSDLGTWGLGLPIEEELARTWHDDMLWWGPEGIGATYTIERYAKQHAGPFRAAFTDRAKTNHICRMAEGDYGGFFGWPNFTARHTGGFMGMPATDTRGEFRVIDMYRRSGDKLAENWIFIDILHFWKSQGVDILGRATDGSLG